MREQAETKKLLQKVINSYFDRKAAIKNLEAELESTFMRFDSEVNTSVERIETVRASIKSLSKKNEDDERVIRMMRWILGYDSEAKF